MIPEHISATSIRPTQRAAGSAPNPFGRTMPNSHASSAERQEVSDTTKQTDSTVLRRMIT